MNNNHFTATNGAVYPSIFTNDQYVDEQWDPGFEAERCVVVSKLGPYHKLFARPANFIKRFYHTLYPLPISQWQVQDQVGLYDDFCIIDVELTIQFQATFDYVSKNDVELEHINANIKGAYESLVSTLIQNTLLNLEDASWVETGLVKIERHIALAVNELLLMHDIQAMSTCVLIPTFKSFPDIKFKEDAAYLLVLKKSFELLNKKQHEEFVQAQRLEQQQQEYERIRLDNIKAANALVLLKQTQDAEHTQQLLLDQEKQQRERFAIEKRLHADKVQQETELEAFSLQGKYQLTEKQQFFERQLEAKTIDEKLAHQEKINEKELAADLKQYQNKKNLWITAKEQAKSDVLKQKQRLKQLQINADIENKAYLYRQELLLKAQILREKIDHEAQLKVENRSENQVNADIENKAYLYQQQLLLEAQIMREKAKQDALLKAGKQGDG